MKPVAPNHNDRCEHAITEGCDCPCSGMLHQRDILIAAIQSRKTASAFDDETTKLYGSAFALLSTDPVVLHPTGKDERSRRQWESVNSATATKARSQAEQRAVDTAVGEILRTVHGLPATQKTGWLPLMNQLTPKVGWDAVANQIRSAAGPHDEASGYFWASMLAATMIALNRNITNPTAADILSYRSHSTSVFDQVRYPRGRSGNSIKTIKEMNIPAARQTAAVIIAAALSSASALTRREKMLVTALTGAVVSADLWRHPSGVRNLLLPALRLLRRGYGASFSLDSPSRRTEKLITEELGDQWRIRGVW